MSTRITAENGASFEVGQLGITVVHPEGIAKIWARLTDAQRVELAAALDPGRRGLHVRLDNQAKTLATFQRERDEWKARAEKAEARTAPAVTRDEIEKVVWDWANTDTPGPLATDLRMLTDALHALVSGDDPAVFVVRESDVEAQAALRNRFGEFVVNGIVLNVTTAEDCREKAQWHLDAAARCESIARAIEAEQDVDPVEYKAREFAALIDWAINDREVELLHTVARHVIGQEDRHVDR